MRQIPGRCGYFPSWKLICATAATNTTAHAQNCTVGNEPPTKDDVSAGINQVTKPSNSWYHRDIISILAFCSAPHSHRNSGSITPSMSTLHLYGLCVSFDLPEHLFILTLVIPRPRGKHFEMWLAFTDDRLYPISVSQERQFVRPL